MDVWYVARSLACGRAAAADYKHTGEDHESGYDLLPCKHIHAEDDAYDGGDDGLDVAVHADEGGTDPFLSEWYEEICHEGGKYDKVAEFPHLFSWNPCPAERENFTK